MTDEQTGAILRGMTIDRNRAQPCALVTDADLNTADPTPGMSRRVALQEQGMWSGTVDTDPGVVSGWHHHGDHETTLYIVEGKMRLESGVDGEHVVEAGPGDFLHVPAGAVHRESNPTDARARAVIVRCGTGTPTINVDGPAADG
ncbi:MAG: cupin domain-containing protein [Antricoccus sp.]